MMNRNIFLIGLMGVGKTSVGRQLARLLKRPFLDADKEIEAKTGVTIPWIFDQEGEVGFRRREVQMIDELTQSQGIVLATGGGAVLDAENRQHLKSRGYVIWLRASLDTLVNRTAHDKNRPLLQQVDARAVLEKLLAQREPLYQSLADFSIDTDFTGGARKTTDRIMHWLKQQEKNNSCH